MDLRELRYGIEIETVKRPREQIAWALHSVVGGHVRHIGAPSCYYPWEVEDLRGRKWKVVNDASLTNVPSHLRAELVSPVLTYDDLENCRRWFGPSARPVEKSTASAASTSISTPNPSTGANWATLPRWFTNRSR